MPGFVIHIAVAKEYIKKHNNEIKDEEKFIEGALAPDLIPKIDKNRNKSETHYGKWGNDGMEINLDKFLTDDKVDMKDDYWKGYFIHLLTDKEFYLKYFKEETEELINNNDTYYYDYDCLNKSLIEKYNIEMKYDENVTKCMSYIDGNPKYLKKEKVIKFIDEITNTSINEQMKLISIN